MNAAMSVHTIAGSPVPPGQTGQTVLATGLTALQATPNMSTAMSPKAGGLAMAGASGSVLGASTASRLGATAGAGADVAVPDDSFATRASLHVDLLPSAHATPQGSVDVPGFLLLALAAAGFALRQLGDRRG